jgi:hypothetical protein
MDVLPRLIAQQTGRPAYNFALLSGRPMGSYYLLRRMLDQGAGAPKAILLSFTPYTLVCDPGAATRGLNEILRPAEAVNLARTARDWRFFAEAMLARLLPSYRSREDIHAMLLQALRGQPASSRWMNIVHLRNWRVNRGSQVNAPPATPSGSTSPLADATYYPRIWYLHPLNAIYVHRFLTLASSRGIKVYWLVPPIRPDIQTLLERNEIDEHYVGYVRKLQATFPGMIVVDGRHAGYGGNLFIDPIHMHRVGAEAFSEGLARVLAQHQDEPAGPRWLDLPPYCDAPPSPVVEDLAQTRHALRGLPTQRR